MKLTVMISLIVGWFSSILWGAEPEKSVIPVDEKAEARISQILSELQGGYGGTMVTSPKDPAIDSATFVQRYLSILEHTDFLSRDESLFFAKKLGIEPLIATARSHQ